VFSFTLLDKSLPPNAEVAWVKWGDDERSWDYHPNYRLPENAAGMIDVCPGNLNKLRGLFTLYRIQGQIVLRFVGFPGPYGVSSIFDLDTPKGAKCLATSRNQKGLTDLVIGAEDGLYHITSAQARRHKGTVRLISGGTFNNDPNSLLKPVHQLHLTQTSDVVSVWFKNSEGDVGYQEFTNTLDAQTQPTPLLLQESGGGTFAALLNSATQCHQFFVVSNDSRLQMLEQSGEKRLWQPAAPISYPSLTDTVKFTSYTTHIHVTQGDSVLPAVDKKYRISSDSETTLKVNGIVKKVGPEGILVATNAAGDVTVIARSDDMTPPAYSVVEDGISGAKPIEIDPADKVKAKLQEIANSEKPEEHKLFTASEASPEAKQQGVAALKGFSGALDSMSGTDNDNSRGNVAMMKASVANSAADGEDRTFETGGGVFQWLTQKIKEIGSVLVDVVKGVWTVVVEWAGKIWNFVLKTATQVLKATRWLLEDVLKIPISAIIDALGFLFAWDDICDTQELLMYSVNSGIDLLVEGAALISEGVDDFFDDLREKVKNLIVPQDLQDQTHDAKGTSKEEKASSVMNSPGGNWSNYQVEHGGVTQESSPVASGLFSDDILASLDETVQEIIDAFKSKIDVVSSRLAQLGDPSSKLSVGSILTLVGGDLADAFIEGTQMLVKGLLNSLGSMLLVIKKAINSPIQVPLLSDLYHKLTGQDLTVLSAMSLLLAVPTTLLYKVLMGKRPRDIFGAKDILDKAKADRAVADSLSHAMVANEWSAPNDPRTIHVNAVAEKDSPDAETHSLVAWDSEKHLFPAKTMAITPTTKVPFWDRMINFLKKVWASPLAYLRDLMKLGAIVGNFISVLLLPAKIVNPDLTRPKIDKKFMIFLVKDFVVFVGTCPFWTTDPQPVPILRGSNWGLGIVDIGFCWLSKRAKAVINFGVGALQAILEIIILVADMCSDIIEHPNRPEGLEMVTHFISVLSAQVAKVAGAIAMHTNGEDGYSLGIAVVSAAVVPVSNLITYGLECAAKNPKPKQIHVISILQL
jgi:hypothetical protein